jgi:G3E family GTPase
MTQDGRHAADASSESVKDPIQIVMVSGFLGAGKTTTLRVIGERLTEQGYTVGMLTNDQASGLVDTSILDQTDGTVVEIPGGCFCCNFGQLLNAAHSITTQDVDILLAEPVGSCTDLVATVINPLREMYAAEFSVAPLTAILDPARVQSYFADDTGSLPAEVAYIFRLQVEEADLLALNKVDTLSDDETARLAGKLRDSVGDRPVVQLSATQQEGVDRLLSAVLDSLDTDTGVETDRQVTAERRALTEIDYDIYAEGEARLGWVNMTVSLDGPVEAPRFQTALMNRLGQTLRAESIEVAHLKFSLAADDALCHANLTSTDSDPEYSGADLGTVTDGRLVLNARAVGDPERIRTIVSDALAETATQSSVGVTVEEEQAFRPAYPEPTHRIEDGRNPDPDGC